MIPRPGTSVMVAITAVLACALSAIPVTARAEDDGESGGAMAAARLARSVSGEVTVSFDGDTQKRLGLRVRQLAAATRQREVMAFGRALDTAPLHAQAVEIAAAEVSALLSQQELGRLRQLQDNTSERRMQTAEAEARRDQLALQAARNQLRLTWGNNIADRDDLPDLVQSLVSQKLALIRLDLAIDDRLSALPARARIIPLGAEASIDAEVVGMAPTVSGQDQAQGILVLASLPAGLPPGMAITGYLELPGDPLNGVVIPRSAVVRYNGRTWVYVQTGAATFSRREVALENPLDDGWLLSRGLGPDDRIVESGAQLLLSEERKSEIEMDD